MKPKAFGIGLAGAIVFFQTFASPPAATRVADRTAPRAVTFETSEVTEAAVALSPDGSTLVFTMLGHLFRIRVATDAAASAAREAATAEQLTFGPYFDGDPTFSPDGSTIAFVSDRGAREGYEFGIFLLDAATKRIRQLTREPFAIRPVFTSSGEEIDYLSTPDRAPFPGALILRQISVSGGVATTLQELPAPYRSVFRLADGRIAWSIGALKRGSNLVETRIETLGDDAKRQVIATCDGTLERVEASPSGDGVFARRTLGGGWSNAYPSEDLVFVATGGGAASAASAVRSIAPVDSKSGPRPRIAVGWGPAAPPPASTRSPVVFFGDAGHLVRIDTVSGAREIVPTRARVSLEILAPVSRPAASRASPVIANPVVTPDGSLIFEAAGHLWMQTQDGAPARRIEDKTASVHAIVSSPALSPSGTMLAFVRSEGTKVELRVSALATGEARTIAEGAAYAQPAWSADGTRLVFVESTGFSASVVSMGSHGESRTELSEAGFWSARPNLSADGRSLYMTENLAGDGTVFKKDMTETGSPPEPMTALTRHASDGLVSPDGKWLAFRRNKEIWIGALTAPPAEPAALTDADVRRLTEAGGDGFSFAADSSAVIYAAAGHVYRQPVAGGPPAEIPVHLELPRPRPHPLLIRKVRVLNYGKGAFGPPTSVFIEDGRIRWIGSESGREIPGDAAVLDAAGKFAIPGLFDMHAHATGANQAAFIAYGVTSVRDTGGSIVGSSELADRGEAGDDPMPRYFFAGEIFEGEHPFWGDAFLQIQNEDDARLYVRRFKTAGASFIKVYPSLPWPLQLAVIDEARRLGIPVVGHGMSVSEITRGVTYGFSSIEHTVFPLRIYDDVIRMLAASQTSWDPTLAVVGGDSQLLRKDPALLLDPKLVALTPQWAIETAQHSGYEKDVPDEELNKLWADHFASLREARAQGVRFAIGTDAPNPACFYGASLHWEMEFFVAAGFPPLEVLRIATLDAARMVGASDLGVIAPGKLADLVLLSANPLENIKNTQAIWRTVKGGWVFDPVRLRDR